MVACGKVCLVLVKQGLNVAETSRNLLGRAICNQTMNHAAPSVDRTEIPRSSYERNKMSRTVTDAEARCLARTSGPLPH